MRTAVRKSKKPVSAHLNYLYLKGMGCVYESKRYLRIYSRLYNISVFCIPGSRRDIPGPFPSHFLKVVTMDEGKTMFFFHERHHVRNVGVSPLFNDGGASMTQYEFNKEKPGWYEQKLAKNRKRAATPEAKAKKREYMREYMRLKRASLI